MKKVVILISLACVFIGYVMFTLMKEGVSLQERRMVKWSSVEDAEKSGFVVARHIYPLLKEQKEFYIQGQSDFAQTFKKSFVQAAKADGLATVIHSDFIPRGYTGMTLEIVDLSDFKEESCDKKNRKECLKVRASKMFLKKERDLNLLWIQMWRVSKNKINLFYKKSF